MKKVLGTLIFFITTFICNAQLVDGKLLDDNRAIINNISPIIESKNYSGEIIFVISVNNDGVVTSAIIDEKRSTIISTPARIEAKKQVLKLRFKQGNHFPKYHIGNYRILFKKK